MGQPVGEGIEVGSAANTSQCTKSLRSDSSNSCVLSHPAGCALDSPTEIALPAALLCALLVVSRDPCGYSF